MRVRRKFDQFTILKQIGEGGMSRVFEAEDENLGRHVALKILNRTYSRDAQRMAQFQQEALITARVTHPNVIKLFSVGFAQGQFFIAMELVTGGSLEARIKRDGIVREKDALRIGRQVAEGLGLQAARESPIPSGVAAESRCNAKRRPPLRSPAPPTPRAPQGSRPA